MKIKTFRQNDLWHDVFEEYARQRLERHIKKEKALGIIKVSESEEAEKKVEVSKLKKAEKRVTEMKMDPWLSPTVMREKVINSPWFLSKGISEDDIDHITIVDNLFDEVTVRVEWTHHVEEEEQCHVSQYHRQQSMKAERRNFSFSDSPIPSPRKEMLLRTPTSRSLPDIQPTKLRHTSRSASRSDLQGSPTFSPRAVKFEGAPANV